MDENILREFDGLELATRPVETRTEARQSEQRLKRKARELESINKESEAFSCSVS